MYGSGKFEPCARAARAPALRVERRQHAVAVTPARMRADADGRLPVSRCSSLRSSISFTGAFALLAPAARR